MPTPAWRLTDILANGTERPVLVYKYATYRTNEELVIHRFEDGSCAAYTTGTEGKNVTDKLSQERWAEIYQKAIAAKVLLGRKPEIIEEIF